MLTDSLVNCDISAQETCHLILKLPLSISSRTFVSLNVNHHKFQCVSISFTSVTTSPTYIDTFMAHPIQLEAMPPIELTKKWTFKVSQKNEQWNQFPQKEIVHVSFRFTCIPARDTKSFHEFCWSKLILYHPFQNIDIDFCSSEHQIIS